MIRSFRSLPENIREWQRWINKIEEQGTFTGTLTGMSATTTEEFQWRKIGDVVTLSLHTQTTGTSNSTAMTLTGIPAKLEPPTDWYLPMYLLDNGSSKVGMANLSGTTITFSLGATASASGFTSSGSKGLRAGWQFRYVLP